MAIDLKETVIVRLLFGVAIWTRLKKSIRQQWSHSNRCNPTQCQRDAYHPKKGTQELATRILRQPDGCKSENGDACRTEQRPLIVRYHLSYDFKLVSACFNSNFQSFGNNDGIIGEHA